MADQMKPTPRSTILGLFSDVVNLPLEYMSSPERTQQMQGAAQFLYGTGIPKTLERMSYGDSLFSGSGMTLRPREETINAAMNVAPFAPAVAKVLPKIVRATEGLPVGMSIKDVGKNIFEDATKYHQKVPEIKSINVDKLKRMNAGEVADVSDEVAAKMDFSKPIQVSVFADGELRIVDGHHRVAAAKKLGIKSLPVELQAINAKGSTLNKLAQEATYPQQAALDLAQQRAALPIEQGGLGLPANNTPEMRAQAMGGKDMVHFSRAGGDYATLDSGQYAVAPFDAVGTHVGTPQAAMERFQNTVGYKVNNPNYANDELRGATYPVTILGDRPLMNQNGMPWGEDDLNAFLRKEGGHNWSDIQGGKMTYQDMNAALRKKLFEEQGYTSIPYFNEVEGKGSISYIVPPENIRSRFAAFDPFRKDVATATAMGVAAPDLLAQTIDQYQIPQETTPMYTDPFGNTIGSSIR